MQKDNLDKTRPYSYKLMTSRARHHVYVTRWETRAIFPDVISRARNACAEIRWRRPSLGTQDAECATLGHRSSQKWGVLAESTACILPSFAAATAAVAAAAAKRPNWSWNTARGAREGPRGRGVAGPVSGPAVCSPQSLADAWTSRSVELS